MLKQINEGFDKFCKSMSNPICESNGVREYSDMLYDMLEEGELDAKSIAQDLIYWCSEDDIKKYMIVNDIIDDEPEDEE